MIVFIHLPKAAGTTLSSVFRGQYGKRSIFKLKLWSPDQPDETQARLDQYLQKLRGLIVAEPSRVKIVTGHTHFGIHAHLPGRYFTMLREPVGRVVSLFRYLRDTPTHHVNDRILAAVRAGKMTIEEFVEQRLTLEASNDQTRRLAGQGAEDSNLDDPEAARTTLERAKQNLQNHFEVVGLTERFDESILLLQRAFGWRRPFYEKKNVGAVRRQKDELPAATRDLIARHNALDLELYEFARDRFEKSIAQLGANFPSDLRRFRRMNSYYPTFKRGLIAVSDQLRSLSQHVPLARPLSGKCRDYLYQYHGVGADESSADSSMNAPSVS